MKAGEKVIKILVGVIAVVVVILIIFFMLGIHAVYSVAKFMHDNYRF